MIRVNASKIHAGDAVVLRIKSVFKWGLAVGAGLVYSTASAAIPQAFHGTLTNANIVLGGQSEASEIVATPPLPIGTYTVSYAVGLNLGASDNVVCSAAPTSVGGNDSLFAGAGNGGSVGGVFGSASMNDVIVITTANDTITVTCNADGGKGTTVSLASITAVREAEVTDYHGVLKNANLVLGGQSKATFVVQTPKLPVGAYQVIYNVGLNIAAGDNVVCAAAPKSVGGNDSLFGGAGNGGQVGGVNGTASMTDIITLASADNIEVVCNADGGKGTVASLASITAIRVANETPH